MKLLYITNGISEVGGLERVLSLKASYFADHYRYKVHILCLDNESADPFYHFSDQIKFHYVPVKGFVLKYFPYYKRQIQSYVNKIQPDIICVCDDGLKGFLLPKIINTRAKWVYERHVSKLIDANESHGPLRKIINTIKWRLMDRLGRNYHRFVVLTEGNKEEWPFKENIIAIPNPLSFYPEISSNLTKKIVICVGKISYQKGQDLLLEIWNSLSEDFPDWELHWYGKECLEYLNTKKLPPTIRFFPPEKNIEAKYLESSVYAMASRYEGFGMVLIEAMACGVPCVSFDCNHGPKDIISHGEDGYLVSSGDLTDFGEKMKALMKDENKRRDFGKKAKKNVEKYFVEKIMEKWDALFQNLRPRDSISPENER